MHERAGRPRRTSAAGRRRAVPTAAAVATGPRAPEQVRPTPRSTSAIAGTLDLGHGPAQSARATSAAAAAARRAVRGDRDSVVPGITRSSSSAQSPASRAEQRGPPRPCQARSAGASSEPRRAGSRSSARRSVRPRARPARSTTADRLVNGAPRSRPSARRLGRRGRAAADPAARPACDRRRRAGRRETGRPRSEGLAGARPGRTGTRPPCAWTSGARPAPPTGGRTGSAVSAGDPQDLNPWVGARGDEPYPPPAAEPARPPESRAVPLPRSRRPGPARTAARLPRRHGVVVRRLAAGGTRVDVDGGDLRPPSGLEEATVPLGAPPAVPPRAGRHAFTALQPDGVGPVAYSPCRPDPLRRPARRRADRGRRVRRCRDRDRVGGDRSAVRRRRRDAGGAERGPRRLQPDAYGRRWAPVLVAWSTPAETPELAGDVAGIGGSAAVTRAGRSVYVTGSVTLDAVDLGELMAVPERAPPRWAS